MAKNLNEFDELISEIQDISDLKQKGYDFRLQTFLINDAKNLDEWNESIEGLKDRDLYEHLGVNGGGLEPGSQKRNVLGAYGEKLHGEGDLVCV